MPVQVAPSSVGRIPCELHAIILVALLCCPAGLRAADEDPAATMFSLHGFGTLGVVHSDARDADFVGSPFQPNGTGYSQAWSPGVDSNAGLQLGAQFTDKFSAVLQVVSQHLYDNTWRPQLQWANLKYQLTPAFSIRAGRFVAAPFMLSDTSLVGYTYPWIRLPPELYSELPVSNQDGLDLNYHLQTGGLKQSLSIAYGQTKLKIEGGGEVAARKFLQISDALEIEAFTLRIGYTSLRGRTDVPTLDPLFAGFAQFGEAAAGAGFPNTGAQATALGDLYSLRESSAFSFSMATVGVSYEPGEWLLMSEWAKTASDGLLQSSTAWYLMVGHRFGSFTPYLTLGQVESNNNVESGINTVGLPAPLVAAAAALNEGLAETLLPFAPSQSSATVGTRWDVAKDIDLKLQYDRVRLDNNSIGLLRNPQPGFRTGQDVNVVSLALDFVF